MTLLPQEGMPLRGRVGMGLERAFPGMGWRPVWMTAVATWALVLYHHHGTPSTAPGWWIEAGRSLTGIQAAGFHQHGWAHFLAALVLLTVPLLLTRFGTGMGPEDLGFRVRGAGRELRLVLLLWVVFLPVIWIVSGTEAFAQIYPRLPEAEADAGLFFAYEAVYLVKWISWEFFFRGFMLFGFFPFFGIRAVLVSTIPFTLMHVGKPELEMFSAFPAGLILCVIAFRSKSIWPGVILHSMVAATLDFFACGWWR